MWLASTRRVSRRLPTYVVPLVFIKNTNSADTAAITNLTQRQACVFGKFTLADDLLWRHQHQSRLFCRTQQEAAVRTEIDLNIYNTQTINTYYTKALGQPVLDTSADPGLTSGGAVTATVLVLTNSIGTVAVQNIKKGVAAARL